MGGFRRTLIVGGLVGLIAAAVIWTGIFLLRKPRMRGQILTTPTELIDEESLKLMTKSLGEWERLGKKDGKYKNPKTGKYTMVAPMTCASCGAKIPNPLPMATRGRRIPQDSEDLMRYREQVSKIMAEYRCPECGKPAFGGGGGQD